MLEYMFEVILDISISASIAAIVIIGIEKSTVQNIQLCFVGDFAAQAADSCFYSFDI